MPFTASIIERSFAYVPDRILKLGGAAWLRPLGGSTVDGAWERIRIGILCAVTPNGTSNISDTAFWMGLCSGQQNPGSAYNSQQFVGASLIGPITVGGTRLLTYTANSSNPYFSSTVGVFFQKIGTLFPWVSANFTYGILMPLAYTGTDQRRGIIIIDIAKTTGGSGALTISAYNTTTAATMSVDYRPDHLWDALDQPGVPSVRNQTFITMFSSTAIPYSPALGNLDTFEIFWSNATFPLEISAIGAVVMRAPTYTGTNATGSSDETFEEYDISTSPISDPAFLNGGMGWAAAGTVTGTLANLYPQSYSDLAGTTIGTPVDSFENYAVNDSTNGVTSSFVYGSYWAAGGVLYNGSTLYVGTSSANLYPMTGTSIANLRLAGTTYGTPYDTFEAYAVGAVVSGVTLNAGSYWSGYGTLATFSYP